MLTQKGSFFLGKHIAFPLLVSVALLLGDVSKSNGESVAGITDTSVKIGLMGDLTGPLADGWLQIADGAKAFFKMVNNRGGIHGRKIKYILEDDRYSIPLALACFKKLVYKDKVFIMQAASGWGHTAALIPLVEKQKIPLLAGTGEKKFFIPARRYIFSVGPWYEDQAKLVVEYIFNDLKMKNSAVALMYPDTVSGKQTRDAFRKLIKVYPVTKYREVTFSLTALDYTSEVLTLKQFKPDVLCIHGYVVDTTSIAKAARRLGLNVPILVNQYACADEVMAVGGKAVEGIVAVNCFGTWDDDSPGVATLRKATLAYNPKVQRRSAYFFQGWIVALMFCEGFRNAGRDLTREIYVNGLEAIRDFDTQGICGIISFGPNDRKPFDNHRFYKADINKKKFVPISGWRTPREYDF